MSGLAVLAILTVLLGWGLMIAVGILHGAGAFDWTLSYDEAVALVALLQTPWLILAAAFLAGLQEARKRP